MARRNDHTRDEIKAMAINAGQILISEDGFTEGFSARKVAKKIGYTVGTLYNVFKNYDDIIIHINSVTLDDMNKYVSSRAELKGDPASDIKCLAHCYLSFAETNYNRWSTLFEHSWSRDEELPDWYQMKLKKLFASVEYPLVPIFNDNKEALEHHAKTIWAGVHGICALALTNKLQVIGDKSVQKLLDTLVDNYIYGLNNR